MADLLPNSGNSWTWSEDASLHDVEAKLNDHGFRVVDRKTKKGKDLVLLEKNGTLLVVDEAYRKPIIKTLAEY